MARIHHARPQHAPKRGATLDQSRAARKEKKPYKIVLEAVTQEKKKLHSILTYGSNAPSGFGYIPAGHPEFTEWAKEQCRQRNLDVHVVSAKPKNRMHTDPAKLSHHVHRIGHHFPLEIIQLACSRFGYTYDQERGLRKVRTSGGANWIAQHVEDYSSRQPPHELPTTEEETRDYIIGAVREMFPKIPEPDVASIVDHAFAEGSTRVGNAKNLSLARKIQLAVVAHIRHTYTDYDKLLKTDGWLDARTQVEPVSLAKLKEWRDETGEMSNEIEETFREVIVLDDDDDNEVSSDDGTLSIPDEREQSMEIVTSRATARDMQPERSTDYAHTDIHDGRRLLSRTIVVRPYHPPPSGSPGFEPVSEYIHESRPPPPRESETLRFAHNRPVDPTYIRRRPGVSQPGQGIAPIMIDGRLYQLEPINEPRGHPRVEYHPPVRVSPYRVPQGYVHSPPRPNSSDRRPTHVKRPSDPDVILPSVEDEAAELMSPRRIAESRRPSQDRGFQSGAYVDLQPSKRKAIPTLPDAREAHFEHSYKRPRAVQYVDEIHSRPAAYQSGLSDSLSYQSMDTRNRSRAAPHEVIDLTSSPYRRPVGDDRGFYRPVRPDLVDSDGHAYVPMPTRRQPMRAARGMYHDGLPEELARAYPPDYQVYTGPPPPARDNFLER